jgi:ATP-dependent Lon protease
MKKEKRESNLGEKLNQGEWGWGGMDFEEGGIGNLRDKIRKKTLPPEVENKVLFEAERLKLISPASAEYGTIRNHLEWILSLPWKKSPPQKIDIKKVEEILDKEYYGKRKVKDQILEYLSIKKLKKDLRGFSLCFCGPPGTGKTALAQILANALERKFARISIAGIRDEAEIRGHRMTYMGALPGKIIRSLRETGTSNPLILIEEIDRIGSQALRGEPTSALLEALDPELNSRFIDYYLGIPYDLSDVMFVTTATVEEEIPAHILDVVEVVPLTGFVEEEKIHIAKKFLIPHQLSRHGLTPRELKITDTALKKIIRQYAIETGLRNLQRQIQNICRKCAREKASKRKKCLRIDQDNLEKFLGAPIYIPDLARRKPEIGVVTGLAWTASGGDIMLIEALKMPGSGQVISTGQLGEQIRESIQTAHSFVRSMAQDLNINYDDFINYDIHIHFPSTAIPKDGSSAGCAISLVIASVMSEIPTRNDVAISGEASLRGRILPVMGIKEKVSAAARVGIKNIILPKSNEENISEVPEQIRKNVNFIWVERMEEVFKIGLVKKGRLIKNAKIKSENKSRKIKTGKG